MSRVKFMVAPKSKVRLKRYRTEPTDDFEDQNYAEKEAAERMKELSRFREIIAASHRYSVLIIEAGMDAAGKDRLVGRIFNPAMQCRIESFRIESFWKLAASGVRRDFLSRFEELLPVSGETCVFNRSYYEHLTLDRVHPELLDAQHVPKAMRSGIWSRRCAEINHFEKELADRHCIVIKLFLHLSRHEQKKRFLQRIEMPEKQYKFDPVNDMDARTHWLDYRRAFEFMLSNTSTEYAPWFIVPADVRWAANAIAARAVCERIREYGLALPTLSRERKKLFLAAKLKLESE